MCFTKLNGLRNWHIRGQFGLAEIRTRHKSTSLTGPERSYQVETIDRRPRFLEDGLKTVSTIKYHSP